MDSTYDPQWLDKAMIAAGVQTGELAEASNVSRSQIQRIRNGSAPRMDTMLALRSALKKFRRSSPKTKVAQPAAEGLAA